MKNTSQGKLISRFISAVILTSLVLSNVGVNTIMAAPPPPLSSTPTPLSTPDSTGVHQVLPAPPSPQDEFSPKIEEARARAAIEAVQKKYLDYYGPRYQADAIQITLDGAWARGVTLWKIDSKAFDETFTILAHRQLDGNWQAMMPGSDGLYLQWLDAAPESLIPAASKSQLRAQANEAASLQSPQTTPMVPLPVTSAEESNGQVEQQVLAQPTATPTAMPSVIVTLPSGWPSKPVGPLPTPVSGVIPLIILGNDDESGPASSELLIQQEVANASASCSDADSFQFPVGGANDHSGWNRTTQFGGTTVLGPGHLGEDYDWASGDETGKPVVATANGKVFYATGQTALGGYGGAVVIEHHLPNGEYYTSITGHLAHPVSVSSGSCVTKGQLIGYVADDANDGGSWSPHVHFGIRNGAYDPGTYLCSCCSPAKNYWVYIGNEKTCNSHFSINNWQNPTSFIQSHGGGGSTCSAPNMSSPNENYVSPGNTITFVWSQVSCSGQNGYYLRVGTSAGGSDVLSDYFVQGLQTNYTFGSQWYNRDLYWSVRANASGAAWSSSRKFRIEVSTGCNAPSADQVALYADGNYGGQCVVKNAGEYANPSAIGLPNDSISSIKVGSNVKATLCGNDNFGGTCEDFTSDDGNLSDNAIGNDSVSSAKVQTKTTCSPNADQVALFVDPNYGGQCTLKGVGDYANPSAIGLPNDSISSVQVGNNVKLKLCRDDNYSNTCEDFVANDSNLADNSIGDNSASSARVQQRITPPSAPSLQSPGNGSTFNEGQSINLSWSATGDQYYGEVWGGPGGTLTFGWQSGTSKDLGPQWAGYTYSWHVKARNGAGDSGWSDTWTFTVKPSAPSNLNASVASCTQINLSWNDNSGNEAGYKIYRNGVYVGQVGADVTSYSDSGLSGNTPYSYYVKAFRGSIESNASNTASNTTTSCVVAPSAPTLQSPGNGSPFNEGQEITLCWSASGNEYYGEVWGGPGGTLTFGWQSGTCKNLGSQWAGYTYSWHVKARNTAGDSGWSSTWTFTVKPGTPSGLIAQAVSCDQVNLSWDDNSGNEEGYKVYRNSSYLTTLGAGSTSYQNTSLGANTDYSYYVTAYRGSIESNASGTVTAHTPTCPPSDTEKPVVNWTVPVTNSEIYHVVNQTIQLDVSATDNVGVSWVRFFRWDAVNLQYVEIGNDYTDPYEVSLDCATLNYEWNEIIAEAYDAGGNVSDQKYIWLYRDTPQPDLIPYAPSGYPDPVVPSSITGTYLANDLHAGQPTYFDWHFMNNGWATASGSFYVELWVDETRYISYPYQDFPAAGADGFDDWAEVISTPGWHTVKLVVDPDNTIPESDETNNVWEGQFYWQSSAPYSDDMENGLGDWNATGLWHLIDATNPYFTSYSGSHSWWYGQDGTGDYETGSTNSGDLTSPEIYIPDLGYYLRFFYHYQTETQGPDWDRRWIQVSVDGGDFTNILQLYDDPQNMWLQSQVIDLSGYAGHTIQVRFNFDTLDAASNGYRGWYIDDFEISTTPPPSCADTHEPNGTAAQATSLVYGQTITADICAGGDYDYYAFTGNAGDSLVADIDAQVGGSSLDSYAFLLASDGTSVLAQNDDDAMTTDSKIGYTLPYTGIYYIKVRAYYHPSSGGPSYYYSLRLFTDNADPTSASITSPTNDSWINPTLTTVMATASDSDSGIQRVEFLWHAADWQNSDWVWLGADNYGGDGWSMVIDTSSLAEQQGGAFYIWAFDYTNKWTGASVGNIGLDRTPPTSTVSIYPPYGSANFLDFYVIWDATDNLAGVAGYDLQFRDGIGGSWTDMVTNTTSTDYRFVGENGHTYYFRSRARDRADNLSDYPNTSQASYTVQVCDITPDGWENDDGISQASLMEVDGTPRIHNFHQSGDMDWVKFNAVSGQNYVIQTSNNGGYADTVLYLYDTDGATLLDLNDDAEGLGWASQITWTAPTDGTYYLLVEHFDPNAFGCTAVYGLSVTPTTINYKLYLPVILRQ